MKSSSCKIFFGITLLVSFIGCLIYVYPELERNFVNNLPFEKTKWSGRDNGFGVEGEWEFRPGMARTLVSDKSLIGKSKIEIIEMLGQAEDSYDFSPNTFRYGLIDIYGRNIDPIAIEYLKITFDAENKVEKAEIEFYKTGDWR